MAEPTSRAPATASPKRPDPLAEQPTGVPAPDPAVPLAEWTAGLAAAQQRLAAEVAERERIERALRASEARARRAENRLRQAIESVSAGFALWDADDRLVLANQRYRDLYAAVADAHPAGRAVRRAGAGARRRAAAFRRRSGARRPG